jgi:hypothetical protein
VRRRLERLWRLWPLRRRRTLLMGWGRCKPREGAAARMLRRGLDNYPRKQSGVRSTPIYQVYQAFRSAWQTSARAYA